MPNSGKFCYRFASFNKAFDFEKSQDPWADVAFKESEKDEKTAPIAKLESLDELDLVRHLQQKFIDAHSTSNTVLVNRLQEVLIWRKQNLYQYDKEVEANYEIQTM